MIAALILTCAAVLTPASATAVQTDAGGPLLERPSVTVPRLAPGDGPITLDARLDEPAWDRAVHLGPLTQTVPLEGQPMSVDTDVMLIYGEDRIYIGLVAYDDPAEVRARQMDRDAFVRYDDVIELWFDPFASERFAYWFQVTPAGSLGDALIADNGTSFNKAWDGIWYGDARVTDQGWVAELAIPYQTLSFDPEAPWWGFNTRRVRVANGEVGRWATPTNAYRFFQVSEGGKLFGLRDMRQGLGLDVVPYLKYEARRPESERSFGSQWEAGLDLRWRPNALSTLLVTTNTDFAETEVDTRQINTGRFPLFFPERRDFFLEDAGVFLFGAPSNRQRLVPFFSRRVGLSEGRVVPIQAGVKLTGRFGDWAVGVLDTYLDTAPASDGSTLLEEQNLGVLRLQRDLGDGQQVGMIATSGDPDGDSGRVTLGIDALLGSTRFFGEGQSGFLWAYALGSANGSAEFGETDGLAYGIEARTRNANWGHELRVARTEETFAPALGFVRRTGFDQAAIESDYTWRSNDEGTLFRQVETGAEVDVIRDLAGEEDRWRVPVTLFEAQFWSQDTISLELSRQAETIDTAFDLGGTATVLPGTYHDTRMEVGFSTNDRRLYGLESSLEHGDFYGGTITRLRVEPVFIPNKYLTFGASFEEVDIETREGGRLGTQLYTLRADVNIDMFTSWRNFLQYDTESKDLSAQSRVRWIIEPGRELFVVGLFGFGKEDSRSSFVTRDQSLAVKLELTWRF